MDCFTGSATYLPIYLHIQPCSHELWKLQIEGFFTQYGAYVTNDTKADEMDFIAIAIVVFYAQRFLQTIRCYEMFSYFDIFACGILLRQFTVVHMVDY